MPFKKTLAISAAILQFAVPTLLRAESAPLFELRPAEATRAGTGSGQPLTRRQVEPVTINGFAGLNLPRQAALAYPLRQPLPQGTVVLTLLPNDGWFQESKEPNLLFQLGAAHFEPNSISLLREADGSLVLRVHGEGDRRGYCVTDTRAWRKGMVYTVGFTWDEKSAELYVNGQKTGVIPVLSLPKKWPDRFALGSAVDCAGRPAWGLDGVLFAASVQTGKRTEAEMNDLTAPGEVTTKPRLSERLVVTSNVPYITNQDGVWHIGGGAMELRVTDDGRPLSLYDKTAGTYLIEKWPNGVWWSWGLYQDPRAISNAGLKGQFKLLDQDGAKVASWTYQPGGDVGDMQVRVWPDADGSLRFRYQARNRAGQAIRYVYFPVIGGIKKQADGWVVMPNFNGQLRALDTFKYLELGGPGNLTMLLVGMKTGSSTLAFFPDDVKGCIKFAIADDQRSGPHGWVNLSWQNRDWIWPGESYAPPYAFRLYCAGDTGLRGVADSYRQWAVHQPWYVTWQQKRRANPGLDKIFNGVIKMCAYEALCEKSNQWAAFDWKEKHGKILSQNYARFMTVAESIETLYGVKPAYRYDGWWGRFDSRYPTYFPVDPELGDFPAFIAANNRLGRLVYLHTNPIQYDADSPDYDGKKMAMEFDGLCSQVWSRNLLSFGSPNLILPREVQVEKQMVGYGVKGIFEDVIGCTTMADSNPWAGYSCRERDSGTTAVINLCRALWQATPGVFRGTEGGEERRIPYYDAFMMGPGDVPLVNLVYGDCIASVETIGGGGDGSDATALARNILSGMVLGLDGRYSWPTHYLSSAQMVFETQQVLQAVIGQRILDYTWDRSGLYLSQWADALACANLGQTRRDADYPTSSLGAVKIEGLEPGGVVLVTRTGTMAAWRCRKVTVNGSVILEMTATVPMVACYNGQRLAVAAAGPKGGSGGLFTFHLPAAKLGNRVSIRPQGSTGILRATAANAGEGNLGENQVGFIQ